MSMKDKSIIFNSVIQNSKHECKNTDKKHIIFEVNSFALQVTYFIIMYTLITHLVQWASQVPSFFRNFITTGSLKVIFTQKLL